MHVENTVEREQLRRENKAFYKKLTIVGIPMIMQQVIAVTLNLADTIMVGRVGENPLAAVGAANQVYFIISIILFGVFSGAAVHAVQYWGIKDIENLRKILGIDYMMCFLIVIPASVLAYFFPQMLIKLFSDNTEVITLGVEYLKIVCFSYLFTGISFVIAYNSRSVQDLKLPTIVNGIAIALNIFLNYILIYGNFGFPKLGVKGAAIATLTARIFECVLMLSSVYLRKEHPLKAKVSELKSFSKNLYRRVMKTAVPVIITEGLWAVSVSCIYAAYGKISPSALAISQAASTVTTVFQTIYFGMGNASAVLIGEVLGQGKKEKAFNYSKNVLKVTWVLNVIMTILVILLRKPIADIYGFPAETTEMFLDVLIVYALTMTPKMLSYVLICAIFRPGGDTMFSMHADVVTNIFMQVPLAFISVQVLNLPLNWAMVVVAFADVIKVAVCYVRYYGKQWMNIFTGMEEITEE